MVEHIQLDKIQPFLLSAHKIKRTDSRGHQNQQTPFQDCFRRKQNKKKVVDLEHDSPAGGGDDDGTAAQPQAADWKDNVRRRRLIPSAPDKKIDIRV